jgi:hypothetical protein
MRGGTPGTNPRHWTILEAGEVKLVWSTGQVRWETSEN